MDDAVEGRGLEKRRRISSIILMVVGIPNFLMAIITAMGGFILAGVLIYAVIKMQEDTGEDAIRDLCIVFIAILMIIIIIVLIVELLCHISI